MTGGPAQPPAKGGAGPDGGGMPTSEPISGRRAAALSAATALAARKRRGPVFLARRGYRLRRLRDAARLLPVAGGFLLLLPILWAPAEDAARATATDGIYLFLVWFGLILAAAVLAPRLAEGDEAPDPGGEPH
jgi:hypothetical protein